MGVLIATSRHFDRDCRILTQARRERVIQHVIVFANVLRDRLRRQTANPTELIQNQWYEPTSTYPTLPTK